ncbi:MAG: hypothetical protein MZV63_13185 [Marinilabiliales bacterium]|nr:hypothetical protein [Marinilabiliales bacterium]
MGPSSWASCLTPDVMGFNTEVIPTVGAPGLPFLLGYQDRNFAGDAAQKELANHRSVF